MKVFTIKKQLVTPFVLIVVFYLLNGCASITRGSIEVEKPLPNKLGNDKYRSLGLEISSETTDSGVVLNQLEGLLMEELRNTELFEEVFLTELYPEKRFDLKLALTVLDLNQVSANKRYWIGGLAGKADMLVKVELFEGKSGELLYSSVVEGESSAGHAFTGTTVQAVKRVVEQMMSFVELNIEDIKIFTETIYFEYDRSDLSKEARRILKKMAAALRLNPSYSLSIAGHCDERGTIEYNLALGERRASAAKKYITDLGILETRISTISYGEEMPVDARSTEEAWARNRRAEFKLIKQESGEDKIHAE